MNTLRQGAFGPEVGALQKKLIAAGYPTLKADEHFGIATDQALRAFQRKRGLLPDGIAGARTQAALDTRDNGTATALLDALRGLFGAPVMLAALHARNHVPFLRGAALSLGNLQTSYDGKRFIYREEAQEGKSNVLHWPEGDSGVTLGPGYDMKGRSAQKIITDLQAIGIPKEAAEKASNGAALKGEKAKEFVEQFKKENPGLIKLDKGKEFALLEHVVPDYEKIVKDAIRVDLHQHEFDALVCYAYNVGNISTTAGYINRGEVNQALKVIQSVTTSGGKKSKALVARRPREVALYLHGEYGTLPKIS